MVKFYEEVFQGNFDLKILFKIGNVRNSDPFIILIMCPKIFGLRMLEVWTMDDKNSSELFSFLVWEFQKTMCVIYLL